ncbi:MAG: ATP-binding protein [Candidatus Kapaibacterium sp.]
MVVRSANSILVLDLIVLALCVAGVYRVSERAGLPFAVVDQNDSVTIATNTGLDTDTIYVTQLGGLTVHHTDEIEALVSFRGVGDSVRVRLSQHAVSFDRVVVLRRFYSARYIIIECFAAFIFFLIGIIVLVKLPNNASARTFHHLCISIVGLIAITTGRFTIHPAWLGYALEVVFYAAYLLTPIFFVLFTFSFPRAQYARFRNVFIVGSLVVACIILSNAVIQLYHLNSEHFTSVNMTDYLRSVNSIQLFFVLLFITGIVLLFISYRNVQSTQERKQLRWVFFGICIGVFGFILLWQLPLIFLDRTFIPEEAVLLLSVVAPICFAIAIIRYKAFDIDLLIKRTTLYAIVLGIVFALYVGIVGIITKLLFDVTGSSPLPSLIAALAVAVIFEPLKRRIQRGIDMRFFRSEFDIRKAEREIAERVKAISDVKELAEYITTIVEKYLPVKRLGFFILHHPSDRLTLVAHHDFDLLASRSVAFGIAQLKTDLKHPVIRQSLAPKDVEYESADDHVFLRWDIAAAFPMRPEGRAVSGFLVLGARRSETSFSTDDVEFLKTVALHSSIAIERIRLYEQLIIEETESERLAELNRLKTYFVSSVSHDLKTPLTSISMFSELLRSNDTLSTQKRNEYLEIIQGESNRLSRLIGSVLDFAKLERGTKEYHVKRVELNELIRLAYQLLEYQFKMGGFDAQLTSAEQQVYVMADPDALTDVVLNLLTNAMKYSGEHREISVSLTSESSSAVIRVRDRGVGIAADQLPRIFEAFFRVNEAASSGGAGLGLAIVKHTIDAHHGTIGVESMIGAGSTFTVSLPLSDTI